MKAGKRPLLFYGWIVVVFCFLIVLLVYGVRFTFPAFYVAILEEFGQSRGGTAGPYSLNLLVYGLGAAAVGMLVDRIGPRKVVVIGALLIGLGLVGVSQSNALWLLYPFFGVIVALGNCMAGNAAFIPMLSNWFVKRRGLAIGIYFAGVAGAPVVAPLAQQLIDAFKWRGAYLVLAVLAVAFIVPVAVFVLRAKPAEKGQLPDGASSVAEPAATGQRSAPMVNSEWSAVRWDVPKALHTRQFWALFFVNLFLGMEVNLVFLHQMAHAVDVGYSKMFAASVFGLVGFGVIAGSYAGSICDRIGRELTFTVGVLGSLLGILMLTLTGDASQPWMLYSYAVIFGMSFGMCNPALMASQADLFFGRRFGSINGLLITGFGIGGAVGPYLGGLLFDLTGAYTWSFTVAMAAIAIAGISMWVAAPRKIRPVWGARGAGRLEPVKK
ncbi:MAG: MFS transporter [Dehalococcoidia bacterium]|nr:MFS transporter [Dehalococcoidia bacterium]